MAGTPTSMVTQTCPGHIPICWSGFSGSTPACFHSCFTYWEREDFRRDMPVTSDNRAASSRRLLEFLACVALFVGPQGFAEPIRFAGRQAELVLSEVSERTVRIELSTLDDQGKPLAATPSSVLVPFHTTEKLRARELSDEKEVRVGKLRVRVK